jgi:hypothetical protein
MSELNLRRGRKKIRYITPNGDHAEVRGETQAACLLARLAAMPELFNLSATTPSDGMAHGSAAAHGEVYASAVTRRGIDLRLGFDFSANASGALGNELSAKVAAGVNARAGVALQAAIPLDLFKEAGIVARFQAQAAAAAFVSASVGLELDVFRQRVSGLVAAPLDQLLEIFLDEIEVSAGIWGRAAFAAEILGEAALVGSLLATATRPAGFSFSLQYAAGLGYGAGKEFVANIGFRDPRRLLDRLADRMTTIVLHEAELALAQQPEAVRRAAATPLALSRVLIPLGTRTALRVGFELASSASAERRDAASRAVLDAFAQQAQSLLFQAIADLAFARVADLVSPATVLGSIIHDSQRTAQARAELLTLRQRLVALQQLQPIDASAWISGIVSLLEPISNLLNLAVVPDAAAKDVRHALAMLWSAGVLLERVLAWYDSPARAAGAVFDNTPVAVPSAGGIPALIAEATGRASGEGLRLVDIAAFLVRADLAIGEFRAAVPQLAEALDWIQEIAGSPGGQVFREILIELIEADSDGVEALLTRLGSRAGTILESEILPRVLNPIKARDPDNAALQQLIDELITPLLVALPGVVLPRLPAVGTESGALRLREALSAILLQSLAEFTISTVDVLLAHALDEGEKAMRDLASKIELLGKSWGGLGVIMMAAAAAPLPIKITPQEVRVLLELAADISKLVNEQEREPILAALRALLRLGFDSDSGREAALQTLTTSDEAPAREELEQALTRVRDGSWAVIGRVAPKALELLAIHYLGGALVIAEAIAEGAKEVVKAVENGVALIAAEVAELLNRVQELAGRALLFAGEFAGHIRSIAERVQSFNTSVVNSVRAAGLALVGPLLGELPDWAQDALRALYNALFDAAESLLNAPLAVLASVAGWIENICTTAASLRASDVKDELRRQISASTAVDLHFDLALWVDPPPILGYDAPPFKIFDIGRVTIPAGDVLAAIANTVLGDAIVDPTIDAAVEAERNRRAAKAEEETVRQLLTGAEERQKAQGDAARLVPGAPLVIQIIEPGGESIHQGSARFTVRIQGANRTFVQSLLGVPPRVELRVNGQLYRYDPAHWMERNGGIEFTAVLIPVPKPPAISLIPAGVPVVANTISKPTAVRARFARVGDDELRIGFVTPKIQKTVRSAASVYGLTASTTAAPALEDTTMNRTEQAREHIRMSPAVAVLRSSSAVARAARFSHAISGQDAVFMTDQIVRTVGASSFTLRPAVTYMTLEAATLQALAEAASLGVDVTGTPVIGGREGLNAIQIAIADAKTQQAGERVLFFLERAVPKVVIQVRWANPAGADVAGEYVMVYNEGNVSVDLQGWTIRDLAKHTFRFPAFSLAGGQTVRVWTRKGAADSENLYWGRNASVWNNVADSVILSDATGREINRLSYVASERRPPR